MRSAEKHGFIIVGSNSAKNGEWAPIEKAIDAIAEDTSKRFSIDRTKSFAVGFFGRRQNEFSHEGDAS